MSASTIRTRVRPGEETLRRLAQQRSCMLADRAALAETLAPQRIAELESRGVESAAEFGELRARCDALAPVASVRELEQARTVLTEAERAGSVEEARSAVARIEEESTERFSDRTERELVLEEVVKKTGVKIKQGSQHWQSDGRLTVSTEVSGEQSIPLVVTGSQATGGAGSVLAWQTSRSDIRGDGTEEGACAAQHDVVAGIVDRYGEGMTLEEPGSAAAAAERPHHVTREAR
jgi:hypothetical protein